MNREPSIHITKSSFRKILKEMDIKFPVEEFFNLARQHSEDARIIVTTDNKIKKKVKNITLASNGNANLAAELLYATRIKLKHRGVKKVDENDPQWPTIKKLAEACNIFCRDFDLTDIRAGYIQYLNIGFKRMNGSHRNYLNRLVSMAQVISEVYSAIRYINQDRNPLMTASIHDHYCRVIADRAGFKVDYHDQPDVYVHFVLLREYCNDHGIDPEEWIDSQFEGLAWCNGIPEPKNLMGDKSQDYYAKFKFKNNQTSEEPKVLGSLWETIHREDD